MSKKTIFLIIALFIVTAALLFIALYNTPKTQIQQVVNIPSATPTPYAQTSLSFSPDTISIPVKSGTTLQTVDVIMSTGANYVTGVQLELAYEPSVLMDMSINMGTMFVSPQIKTNKIDPVAGRISYAYQVASTQSPQNGSGTVAILTFKPNPLAIDSTGLRVASTQIELLPKTQVTARGIDQPILMQSSFGNTSNIIFVTPTPIPQATRSAQMKIYPITTTTIVPR